MEKNCSSPSQRGNDTSDDILPKGDLTARPNSLSNLDGPLQARNISRHYCGDILRTKPQHVWTDGFCIFFCVFFSLLPDLVGLMPVRQLIQTKLTICLITDCCHDYGKQGGNRAFSFCLWTNTSSRKEQFNINQVEWSTDPIGYTEGEPKCKHTSEKERAMGPKEWKKAGKHVWTARSMRMQPVLNKQLEENLKTNKQSFLLTFKEALGGVGYSC